MKFENVPQVVASLGLSASELFLVVLLAPLAIGILVGLERELAIFAAIAGLIAIVASGAT